MTNGRNTLVNSIRHIVLIEGNKIPTFVLFPIRSILVSCFHFFIVYEIGKKELGVSTDSPIIKDRRGNPIKCVFICFQVIVAHLLTGRANSCFSYYYSKIWLIRMFSLSSILATSCKFSALFANSLTV